MNAKIESVKKHSAKENYVLQFCGHFFGTRGDNFSVSLSFVNEQTTSPDKANEWI